MILEIANEIKKYLELMHEPVYQNSGWFTKEDEKTIEERGFDVDVSSFYDGKILKVRGDHIWTHSTKCQCSHIIGFYKTPRSILSDYKLFFSEVESNRQWSSDPVYDMIDRDDLPNEDWVIRQDEDEETIGLLSDQNDIGYDITVLFRLLKEYVAKEYPQLRVRIIYLGEEEE